MTMLYDTLYHPQKELISNVRRSWLYGQSYMCFAGQRSGKTLICNSFLQYHPVVAVGLPSHIRQSWILPNDPDYFCETLYPNPLNFAPIHPMNGIGQQLENLIDTVADLTRNHSDLVVVLEEFALWPTLPFPGRNKDHHIRAFFYWMNKLAEVNNRILAIGSPMDSWFRKKNLSQVIPTYGGEQWMHSVHASWELNPPLNLDSLRASKDENPYKFQRDFACGKRMPAA